MFCHSQKKLKKSNNFEIYLNKQKNFQIENGSNEAPILDKL